MQQYATCSDVRVVGTSEPHDTFLSKVSPVLALAARPWPPRAA